ncbi:MAG TPA: DUF1844 domain-containing protein [Patescibacteria group bacterium]|nr:DUF1844 domain-containing protein [Patescibacteria group bacterium]
MEEQEDKRGFKVQDRRRFSAEGEAKEGVDAPQSSEPIDVKGKGAAAGTQTAAEQPESRSKSSEPPPELTFAAFLWSLSEQALAALGEIADPISGKVTHDLTLAQQMIDIIIMLRDKTRGNLDPHEAALLKEILSSLQMKYVELARQPNR